MRCQADFTVFLLILTKTSKDSLNNLILYKPLPA